MVRRRAGSFPLLELDAESGLPLHRQLTEALRQAIRAGRIDGGARLPSTRSLADDLGVSRSTVVKAFEQLKAEGYLESRIGSGTTIPHGLVQEGAIPPSKPGGGSREAVDLELPLPLRPGIPALDEFANSAFGRIVRRVLNDLGAEVLTTGAHAGDAELRAAVARHLRSNRGVRCHADDIIVTTGSQEGLSLAFEVMAARDDEVWIENPGYFGARNAARVVGLRPRPVPVDHEGLVVSEGIRLWPRARGAYVTPSHQFPTGCLLSARRRVELLDWAHRHDAYVVEDDYDSEFRLEGRALPALQGIDEHERVIYVGSFSKSLAPAIRLGFLVLPPQLRDRALQIRIDRTGMQPLWIQRAAALFIEEGHFARHVRRTRALYRKRRDALVEAVEVCLEGRASLRTPTGSMHALLDLEVGLHAATVAHRLRRSGVIVVPADVFHADDDEGAGSSLLLGFGGYTTDAIRAAVERIGFELRGAASL
ncbi:MAG: PLP-dependent aminotransferase family protein [Gemmatimonadota bacterium]